MVRGENRCAEQRRPHTDGLSRFPTYQILPRFLPFLSRIRIAATECAPGSIYNLADSRDLTQGQLNQWLAQLFRIEVSYLGSIVSNLAKLNLSGVAEDANDKHVPGFTQLCHSHAILNTPISPFIDKELLRDNHLAVDGAKITRDTSFKYEHQVSIELIRQQLQSFIDQGVFPPVI